MKDYILAGVPLPTSANGLSVKALGDRFLTAKQNAQASGTITQRTFNDYLATCKRLVSQFGKDRIVETLTPSDFEALHATLAKRWGPVSLRNEINRVRIVFKYGYDCGLMSTPMRFGPGFKRPERRILRREREKKGATDVRGGRGSADSRRRKHAA